MMHFPSISNSPYFRFSLSFLNVSESGKSFPTFPKICMFYPRTFLMTCFVIDRKFRFPPIFAKTLHFSPLYREIYSIPHYFLKFPSDFVKLTCFSDFTCFSFPPSLTMMHLCITQSTYWTPLSSGFPTRSAYPIGL